MARKRKLSATLFERLSQDEDSDVRVAVCTNRKTPLEILDRLREDVNEDVACVATENYERRIQEQTG